MLLRQFAIRTGKSRVSRTLRASGSGVIGFCMNAIGHRGVLDAGTHFLAKPFTAADLARRVREVLDGGIANIAVQHESAVTDW